MSHVDIVGYSASVVLIISFLLSDIRKLRIINSIGCILFILYGVLLGMKWPIIIPNVFITLVNFYHLFKASRTSSAD